MAFTEMEFETEKENWNYYQLADGSKLKIKIIIANILEDRLTKDKTEYSINWSNVLGVIPHKRMKNKKQKPIDDLNFEVINETSNEYSLSDGTKISVKPNLSQISRTDKLDQMGKPIYVIQSLPSVKIKKTIKV